MRFFQKLKRNRKGMTFLEVLISVVILAMIVSPFLGVFVTSARYTVSAQQITQATYAGEAELEDLVGIDYEGIMDVGADFLSSGRQAIGGFFMDVECTPAGVHSEMLRNASTGVIAEHCYIHLLFRSDGSILLTGPDGHSETYTGVSGAIPLTLEQPAVGGSAGFRILYGGSTLMEGNRSGEIVFIVNTAFRTNSSPIALAVQPGTRVVHYTSAAHKDDLTVTGTADPATQVRVYEDVDDYSTAMVRAVVSVYREYGDAEPLCVVEDYLRPRINP